MDKYNQLCTSILDNIGGTENIINVAHCVTRLRFKLCDENKANTEAIKNLAGVVTVMKSGGQYQVVIGNHVSEVYDEFLVIAGLDNDGNNLSASAADIASAKKGSVFDHLIDIISGVVQPLISIMAGTGIIKGLLALLVFLGAVQQNSGTYIMLNTVGDCFMYFFPIFLGYTAAKKFNVNKYIGLAIGAALVYPTLAAITPFALQGTGATPLMTLFSNTIIETPVYNTFFGIPWIMPTNGYASTLIPAIVTVAFASPIERFFRKVLPTVVRSFLVPLFTLLIVIPIAFLVIGPVTNWLSDLIGFGVLNLYKISPIAMAAVLAAIWQILVIFGLHWAIVPIMLSNIQSNGFDILLPAVFPPSFAQIGVVLAILLKTKDQKLREISIPAFISGIFGVTEPAIYGITLPRKKTFIASCLAAGIGGGLVGFFNVEGYVNGGLGIFALPNFVSVDMGKNFIPQMLIVMVITFVVGIAFGFISFKDEKFRPIPADGPEGTQVNHATIPTFSNSSVNSNNEKLEFFAEIFSPLEGEVLDLSMSNDPVFSSGAMGKGVAINPTSEKVYAPSDGEVSVLTQTKHAIGIKTKDGIEVLIHIGMDTVQLNGKHFTSYVAQGDTIVKGQLLLEFDRKAIESAGYSIIIPVTITNTDDYFDVLETENTTVGTNDVLLRVLK